MRSNSCAPPKQKNRATNTQHELLLSREVLRLGIGFRRNVKTLPGKPDVVFAAAQIVVFGDGDFWHGRNWRGLKEKPKRGHNAAYWSVKIATNRRRDRRHTLASRQEGWMVIRPCETDVKKDPRAAAHRIDVLVRQARKKRDER